MRAAYPLSDPKLSQVVNRLVEAYSPECIYLFGSHARGEAGPDSDYDLVVIVPDSASPERCRSRLAYQALWGSGAAADVVVYTVSAFSGRLHLRAPCHSLSNLKGSWCMSHRRFRS